MGPCGAQFLPFSLPLFFFFSSLFFFFRFFFYKRRRFIGPEPVNTHFRVRSCKTVPKTCESESERKSAFVGTCINRCGE